MSGCGASGRSPPAIGEAVKRGQEAVRGPATGSDGAGRTPGSLGRPLSRFQRRLPALLGGLSRLERLAEGFGVETRVLSLDGRRRRYHVLVPRGSGAGLPLVLALHGGAGNALRFMHGIGAREMALRHGFVIVAPQGLGWWWSSRGSWNADSTTRLGLAERRRVDDVRFLEAVVRSVGAEVGTDPDRTYALGVSKGGMMAYRLACGLPDRIAAIAVVAGTLSMDRCDGVAVPLLHIHGSQDENVPLAGGRGRYSARGADWPPVARGIELFRKASGCMSEPQVFRRAVDTVCQVYRNGQGGEVQFCLVEGGGHGWPGAQPTRDQARRGIYISPHFRATEHIARFFLEH
jgi:polyhydroxybutyrate depolymerase